MLQFCVILGLVFGTVMATAQSRCNWVSPPRTGPGLGDNGTVYYWFNTTVRRDTAFEIKGNKLPIVGYYSVSAYVDGLPVGNIPDYKIRMESGHNPYPTPGSASSMPLGQRQSYRISIGGTPTQNHIAIPESALGRQIEIGLRFYKPHDLIALPDLIHTGKAKTCPKYEDFFVDLSLLEGYSLPIPKKNGDEISFFKLDGGGLYPDADPYLAGAFVDGVGLVAVRQAPFPKCVRAGCTMDRRDSPAYSSLIVGNYFTLTTDFISDREMVPESDEIAYFAVVSPLHQRLPKLMETLRSEGYTILKGSLGVNFLVYRQKLAPTDFPESFKKVPFLPSPAPKNRDPFVAARYINLSPIGLFCKPGTLGFGDCLRSGKGELRKLNGFYEQLR